MQISQSDIEPEFYSDSENPTNKIKINQTQPSRIAELAIPNLIQADHTFVPNSDFIFECDLCPE